MDAYHEAVDAQRAARLRYEAELAEWKQAGHDNGDEPPTKPSEPVLERCMCSDATVEAVALLLVQSPRGLLLARDELSGWLRSFDAYRKGRGGDAAHWAEMHRAQPMLIDRKAGDRQTIPVPRAAVSVTGSIQPGTLRRSLGREHLENGLAARLLLAMPPRRARKWSEREIDPEVESAVRGVFDRLFALDFGEDDQGDAAPVDLPLSPEAKAAWVAFVNEHGREQAEQTSGDLAAAWSKIEGCAARIALVVELVGAAARGRDATEVGVDSIRAGVRLARWFAHEARRVYAVLNETDAERKRRKLMEFIRGRGGQVSARDLMRGSSRFKKAGKAREALDALADEGMGAWGETEPGPNGGRVGEVFVLRNAVDSDTTPDPRG